MSARVLFIIGGLFLGAFLIVLLARALLGPGGGVTSHTPTPTPTGFAIIVPPISSVMSGDIDEEPVTTEPGPNAPPPKVRTVLQANWPPEIAEGNSDTVVIWLIQTSEQIYIAQVERDGQTAVPATLVPRGTPDVAYRDAYGSDYKLVSASATLTSANIDILPVGEMNFAYPLDETRIGWQWNIAPRRQGKQAMTAEVRFRWESRSGAPPKEHAVWQYTLDTLVGPPQSAQGITIENAPSAQPQNPQNEQVGFWADALSLVTGLGAVFAFAGGALRWGVERSKGLWKGRGP
jgi:hypothetical protein